MRKSDRHVGDDEPRDMTLPNLKHSLLDRSSSTLASWKSRPKGLEDSQVELIDEHYWIIIERYKDESGICTANARQIANIDTRPIKRQASEVHVPFQASSEQLWPPLAIESPIVRAPLGRSTPQAIHSSCRTATASSHATVYLRLCV